MSARENAERDEDGDANDTVPCPDCGAPLLLHDRGPGRDGRMFCSDCPFEWRLVPMLMDAVRRAA